MFLGPAYLVLSGGIFAGLCALVWIKGSKWFKKKIPETTLNDDATSKKYIENELSVRNLSKEILNDFPHSAALQKRILINLRIVEYKLEELEQFLVAQGLSGKLEISEKK
ncbi:kita-kyushu lung cancer antigen 1 [Petaurus breviceps papuanus]|uniref:kita-kyushu lung cancer antigen 1 n=1 Tax=Petaurus breviceps papuanus TaxID=3040969 RepID=UPI0036DCF141